MKNDYTIRRETSADYNEVENLTREAFWNVYRPGCLEHFVLHRYRTRPDFIPELSLCLIVDGRIIAHVMYAHAEIHADDGRILLQHSMEKAKELGAGALAITGDGDFYGKSGFVVASTKGIHYYAEPREEAVPYFLIKELEDGFLDGVTGTYADPDGYDCEGVDIDAFDARFPPKEKMRLPGQLV